VRRLRAAAALAAFFLLNGCATQKGLDLPDMSDWDTRQAVLLQLNEWQFNGRIGVKTDNDGFNGKLRWVQDVDSFSATISGPLGIGTVRITGGEAGVEITDKDGVSTVLRDVETELQYRYGWTIPVDSLRYWVLGIPDPAAPSVTEFDDLDRVSHLEQGGWDVEVGRYREAGGQQMPARLVAKSGATSVRLVVDKWIFREIATAVPVSSLTPPEAASTIAPQQLF
jgi:outer membrane lipoprotein LolB